MQRSVGIVVVVALLAPGVSAQSSADELRLALESADRVTDVRLSQDSLVVQLGDTVLITGVAVDSLGRAVPEALWGATDGQVFQILPVESDDSLQAFRMWGHQAGQGELGLFLARPDAQGQPRWSRLGGVEVTVLDFPVDRIEIAPPDFAPYQGTSLSLEARVITTAGTVHETARADWTSSDPSVATVDSAGRLRLLSPGSVVVTARADSIFATLPVQILDNPVQEISMPSPPSRIRTGDVVRLEPTLLDQRGERVRDAAVAWALEPLEGVELFADGGLVVHTPGMFEVRASSGTVSATVDITVFPRAMEQDASLVAHVPTVRATDLWVFEGVDGRDYAYIGTLSAATMYAIDVTDPANPMKVDSVTVDGRRVNDVKVNEARTLAIVTSENASNRQNGITLLGLQDPAHPVVLSHYTTHLTGGVHNVWFVGDLVYAVNDGTLDIHIIDVSDPISPVEVGRWGMDRRGKYLHDVSVVDGLAYLSYWNDGVVILDVGAGIAGGTPIEPRFVSSFKYTYDVNGETYGNTHHAVRYGDYLFLGDEIFGCPDCRGPRGYVHVLDVSDIHDPREVARYEVPEAGSHNLWIEDDRLYVGYYQGGLRVVDVSGELRGDLLAQGREIAHFDTSEGAGTLAWGPQPYKGHVFVSDMNSGLWIVRVEPRSVLP